MDSRRSAHPVGSTDCARRTPARISMLFFLLGTFAGIFLLASQGFAEAHSSRSKHYSHRSRFSGPRAPRAPDPPEPSPFFDNGTSRNVTTSAGKAVFLPCKVRHLGDRTVSWIRRRDLHVLTVGRFTYTSDQRFQTIHMENSDSWMLQIQYPQKKDAGVYECQVSTLPKISRFVTLNVIVSKASIPGGPTLYLNSGSTLNLTCEIMESPMAPDFVFWYHNGRVINYEINNRGISIHTEKLPKTLSRLLISNAQPQDSGNYSCVPSNAEPADITVHVLNGENPAAMQHGKHTSSASCRSPACLTTLAAAVLLLDVALRWR
ncbi:hemicentin-1 isoform X2 [Ixodes scapularis]|uniref:hemicentin-1 isoform X2 n=1 Tax=Ixodes scapularis TaxID=6945 RepID=UPI0011617632|nr:hemicentin-1 isoform X2 [Ixodes scapularis]